MTRTGFLAMSLVAISVHAAPPEPEDFARGIPLETTKNADTYELRVPEAVYEIATRPNLGDLRVFDAAGKIVQHALCEVIEHDEPVISRHALTAYGLPPGRDPARQLGTQLAIDIPGGARIRLEEEGRETATRTGGAFEYVLDTRESEDPLTGLELDWQWTSPEGRAELPLKIKASDDLDQWRTVVTRTTLLRIAGGEGPQRITVELPERRYRFLRLVPLDERARDWLETPWALSEHKQNIQTTSIRVAGEALPVDPDNSHIRYFRRDRPAPARELQFDLPDPRLILDVRVSSRNDEDADWRVRTRGRITGRGNDDSSESLEISAIDDDLWRVEVLAGAEALSNQPLGLHFGYRPMRLGFPAQGEGPYLLAYGSRQIPPAHTLDCASWDALVEGGEPAAVNARLNEVKTLGGEARLAPLPAEPISLRLIVLWTVLGAGALLVVGMAISLLRRMG